MTASLHDDATLALAHYLRREVDTCPAAYRANAETVARLEAADFEDALRRCESAEEQARVAKRWMQAYSPAYRARGW